MTFIWAIYHLVRDVLQMVKIENILTQIGSRTHLWCGTYCDYITLPFDFFIIIASGIILRRKKVGILGIGVVVAIFLFLLMWLLP